MGDDNVDGIKNILDNFGNIEIFTYDYEFEYHSFLNRKNGDQGGTLLHYFAFSANEPNDTRVCNLLVIYGADINVIDNSRETPLHKAVAAGKVGITDLLLNHGAYANVQNKDQNTPLHIAVKHCQERSSTVTLKLCDLLLKHGADPNIKNDFHETPLLNAVQGVNNSFPCKEIVKLLLNYGGNVEITDLNQNSAIKEAARLDNKDLFSWCKQNEQKSKGKRLTLSISYLLLSMFQVFVTLTSTPDL